MGHKSPNTETVKVLLTTWVCANWSVITHTTSSRVVSWFVDSSAHEKVLSSYSIGSFQKFWVRNHSILISFHRLQFPHLFWTWSMTTMAPRGDRPWDALLQGHLFLKLSGWFARILRSMETRWSLFICGLNVSFLMRRTSSAFYFFCIWDSYLAQVSWTTR